MKDVENRKGGSEELAPDHLIVSLMREWIPSLRGRDFCYMPGMGVAYRAGIIVDHPNKELRDGDKVVRYADERWAF